jgi:hypothetical protein
MTTTNALAYREKRLTAPAAEVTDLKEDGEDDGGQHGGHEHHLRRHHLLVNHLNQREANGTAEASVCHDEL